MTSFTRCLKTSLTLPAHAKRGGERCLGRRWTFKSSEFGISRPVGYEWLRRYRQGGISAIAERSRRPQESPRRTEAAVEKRVLELRKQYPDWGARKLCVLLEREHIKLARNTIHRILLRHDLVHEEDRHQPAISRFERARPIELWQMDFKGPKLCIREWGRYRSSMITVGT